MKQESEREGGGGGGYANLVDRTGETEPLPELIFARFVHACGSYLTDQGDMVRFISKYQ